MHDLVERVAVLETTQLSFGRQLGEIKKDLDWIRDRLDRGYRPPWSVVVMIAFLSSLSVGLLVNMMRG